MKLFWLTAEMPYPPNTGGRIVMFKRIEYFSQENEIYLFSIVDSEDDIKYKDAMLKYCKGVRLYNRNEQIIHKIFKLFRGPYVCSSRWLRRMKKDISNSFLSINPDCILVDFPQMLGNISDSIMKSGKVVLNQHNTEYKALRDISKLYNNPFKRFAGLIESYRLQRYERRIYKRDLIRLFTFVSIEDKMFFEDKYGLKNTFLVPVGTVIVDSPKAIGENSLNIAYIGKMEYPPNADAVIWFAENVFKVLKKDIHNAKFYIVGKNPLPQVQKLSTETGIVVTGTVKNIEDYYSKCDIIVIPLFHGGGVKVKLLEALGHGKIVITTQKGIEGTIFKHNRELLVANTASEFINSCSDIISHPAKYDTIANCGYQCVCNNFTWSSILNTFEKKLISELQNNGI